MGQRVQGATRRVSTHDAAAVAHGTSLPLETNSVELDPELKDDWGMPAMRVTYKDHPDDLATARFLQARRRKSWRRPARSR